MDIILKQDGGEDGPEFYTVAITGQSGMSQSGLAVLAGVSRQALLQLEDTLASRSPSEALESFVGKPLTLVISDPVIDGKRQGNLKIYKASGQASSGASCGIGRAARSLFPLPVVGKVSGSGRSGEFSSPGAGPES